ncbi:MAG: iron-containing alcohol dehydrogenase, partial [Desulfovibrionaceae bacterium]|nr:iron-containing alcohol dehydrogenase [Desulfovibrionaceae bacterium]
MLEFTYFMPTRIIFGPGKLAVLQTLRLPGVTPLVVSSMGGSQRRNGTLDRVLALLRRNGCAPVLFERVRPNPVLETVYEGVELARREQCDFVLGLGGGSSIDAAKAIAAGAVNDGVFWDYVKGGSGGARRLKHPALPVVAVPT